MDFELTDRDRLAIAFDELRTRGYIADVSMGLHLCCRDCALQAIAQIGDVRDEDGDLCLPDKFVFWHIQKDDWSFVDSGEGFPLPEEYRHHPEEWFNIPENFAEVDAATVAVRLTQYPWLVNPLNLHWMGNADEIVGVLRRHGLQCSVPNNTHYCIEVLPTKQVVRETV